MTQSRQISAHLSQEFKLDHYTNPPSAFSKFSREKVEEEKKILRAKYNIIKANGGTQVLFVVVARCRLIARGQSNLWRETCSRLLAEISGFATIARPLLGHTYMSLHYLYIFYMCQRSATFGKHILITSDFFYFILIKYLNKNQIIFLLYNQNIK